MSQPNEEYDDSLLDEERNMLTLLLWAVKAYSIENDELFSVDSHLANDLFIEAAKSGEVIPVLAVDISEGRTLFGVEMLTPDEVRARNLKVLGDNDE